MAAPRIRLVRTAAGLALCSLACTGCLSGRSVGAETPTTAGASPPAVVSSAPTSAVPAAEATTTTQATTTTTASAGPPYPLDSMSLPLVDRSRPTVSHGRTVSTSRSLPTTVWFPARPGRWPLIVFAHGFQVGPVPYTDLLEAWAAHGYVVAAPAFPLTDQAIAGANLDEADIDNQPADVRFVTDQLVSPADPVSSRIDAARVAVAGHSDGAETALAAATDPVPAGEPSYRAVLVLSGQPVPGAAGRNPPILIAQGDADTINPPSLGYGVWDQAAPPRFLLIMKGAGHLPPYEPGSPWLAGIDRVTEAFLDAYVAGDRPASVVPASAAGYPNLSLSPG